MSIANAGVVVIGAGQAGGRAVQLLRAHAYTGPITLIGEEPHLPYERPPLSKECLSTQQRAIPTFVNPANYYEATGITTRLRTRVERIEARTRSIRLADGGQIYYEKLLLAPGSRPQRLPDLEQGPVALRYLRTIDDAWWLADRLLSQSRVVIVGGGVIGAEVAASAIARGCAVTLVEADKRLMARCVSPLVSLHIEAVHRSKGVEILLGHRVTSTDRDEGGSFARLDDGRKIPADLIIVGIGVTPNAELGEAAGLEVNDGVVVDANCLTSDPHIYAVGDVARQFRPYLGRVVRLESWANANEQANAAVMHMLNEAGRRAEIPWFWTDQYDLNIQVAGDIYGDDHVIRGEMATNRFCVFHLREGVVIGATTVNSGREMALARRLIERHVRVPRECLSDPGVNLRELANRCDPEPKS